jgi:arginine/ornithine transport system permease protein
MPDFIVEWLNQNEIFTAMTLMEYWDGLVTTVQLVFLSLVIGLVVAVPLAILRTVKNPFVSGPIWLYTYLFRGTPLLIQLYIIYYGVAQIPGIQDTFWWAIFREPFYPALLAFTLNTAAYTTEIIRGAIVATPHGEIEAAKAYGMNWAMRMRRIILPSAARNIYSRFYAPFDAFIFVALCYMALTFMLVFAFRKLENHLLRHQKPVSS